jgi:hypothetical protein
VQLGHGDGPHRRAEPGTVPDTRTPEPRVLTSGQLFLEEYYALAVIGKAGAYEDIAHCDAIFLFGHNMAETQTVLWSRVLDRTAGPDRPRHAVWDFARADPATGTLCLHTNARVPGA